MRRSVFRPGTQCTFSASISNPTRLPAGVTSDFSFVSTSTCVRRWRSCHAAPSLPDVVAVLEGIIAETGIEQANVRCDNGPEFTAEALLSWCATAGVKTASIDPGSPWQNGFIESFNAQSRREQLAGEIIDTMAEARYLAEEYRSIYNQERPHGSLNGKRPNSRWHSWAAENQTLSHRHWTAIGDPTTRDWCKSR